MPIRNLSSEFQIDTLRKEVEDAIEKKWTVRFEKVRSKRTLQQNSYYWALVTMFAIETGYTPDEAHTDLRRSYGLHYEKNGKRYLRSTKTLNTKEMTDYIEWIRNEMAKNGIKRGKTSAEYLKQHWQEYQAWRDEHKQQIGEQDND